MNYQLEFLKDAGCLDYYGASRDIDAALWNMLYPRWTNYRSFFVTGIPPLTSSIDAATLLVPDHLILRNISAVSRPGRSGYQVEISESASRGGWLAYSDISIEIAICAAALYYHEIMMVDRKEIFFA